MDDRFAVNAALERLLADGDTFDPADAAFVIAKVPLSKGGRAEFKLGFEDRTPGRGAEGHAAGVGNVRLDDGTPRVKEIGYEAERTRVGGYKISHLPGSIRIELMWAETSLEADGSPKDGSEAILRYDRLTKAPRLMKLSRTPTFGVVLWPKPRFEYVFQFTTYHPWEKPALAA